MSESRIAQIILNGFRNHAALSISPNKGIVALVGDNGTGKTNILEAISLFTPGRGLRRAELCDMVSHNQIPAERTVSFSVPTPGGFSVSISLETGYGEKRLGTGISCNPDAPGKAQRIRRIDGITVSSASAFLEYLRILWLTPDMDGLFRGSAGERRRFLDRLVLAVDKDHGSRVNALERSLRSRNKILEETPDRAAWLDAVEREIAELGIAVVLARREGVDRLTNLINTTRNDTSPFPFALLDLKGEIDTLVAQHAAVDAEELYRAILRQNRQRDRIAGRTLIGPQASDLVVRHGPKDIIAERASTGEQKALLIGLILAQAHLIKQMSGFAPLVLLDEIAAHLDERRKMALFDDLESFSGQIWITGADRKAFDSLMDRASVFELRDGGIHPLC